MENPGVLSKILYELERSGAPPWVPGLVAAIFVVVIALRALVKREQKANAEADAVRTEREADEAERIGDPNAAEMRARAKSFRREADRLCGERRTPRKRVLDVVLGVLAIAAGVTWAAWQEGKDSTKVKTQPVGVQPPPISPAGNGSQPDNSNPPSPRHSIDAAKFEELWRKTESLDSWWPNGGIGNIADEGASYKIKFTRPSKVGDKLSVSGTAIRLEAKKLSLGDRILKQDLDYVEMTVEGQLEVTQTDRDGNETAVSLVIEDCRMRHAMDEPLAEAIRKGTRVSRHYEGGKDVVSSEGGELSDDLKKLVGEFIVVHDESLPTEDEFEGTTEKKRVGESWPARGDLVARILNKRGKIQIEPKDVHGTVTLRGVEDAEGVRCLLVTDDVQITGIALPGSDSSTTIRESTLRMQTKTALPIDMTQSARTWKVVEHASIRGATKGKDGETIDLDFRTGEAKSVAWRPSK